MPSAPFLAGVAEIGDALGIDILNPLASDWMIVNPTDASPIIVPDTVPRFEYRGESRIADYPMEQGAFASYNKVQEPFDIRMVMVCAGMNYAQSAIASIGLNIGRNAMQKSDFLTTLDYMRTTTDLFDVVTPDRTYPSVNLVHYDYRRETSNGATMLLVEAWFREVRVTGTATYTQSNSPSAADAVNVGTVHAGDSVTVTFPNQGTVQ